MGTVEECRQQINREMRYQSSMDLDETTYAAIRHLPLARELVRTSRQQLVSHLDTYCRKHKKVFDQVWLQHRVSYFLTWAGKHSSIWYSLYSLDRTVSLIECFSMSSLQGLRFDVHCKTGLQHLQSQNSESNGLITFVAHGRVLHRSADFKLWRNVLQSCKASPKEVEEGIYCTIFVVDSRCQCSKSSSVVIDSFGNKFWHA